MARVMIRAATLMLVVLTLGNATGCIATRRPVATIEPSYSYVRPTAQVSEVPTDR